jgi:hypothetical protein
MNAYIRALELYESGKINYKKVKPLRDDEIIRQFFDLCNNGVRAFKAREILADDFHLSVDAIRNIVSNRADKSLKTPYITNRKAVIKIDLHGNIIEKYESLKAAALGLSAENKNFKSVYVILSRALNSGETAYRHKWKPADEN